MPENGRVRTEIQSIHEENGSTKSTGSTAEQNRIANNKSDADNVSDFFANKNNEGQFLYAGENAKNANIARLDEAKELEKQGKDREEIWRSTGWSKGQEGRWKFEIDDSKAHFTAKEITGTHKLSDILEHDALYAAYPGIKNVKVAVTDNVDKSGTYSPEFDAIFLDKNASPEKMRKTLLHEVQHAVQEREGFARGANSSEPNYRNTAGEIEARDVAARADMTAEQRQANFPESMKPRDGVVFADRGVIRYLDKDSETKSIKQVIRENLDEINSMMPVGNYNYKVDFSLPLQDIKENIINAYKQRYNFDGKDFLISRDGYGNISVGVNVIRGGLRYLSTDGEFAATLAIPDVIQYGKEFYSKDNFKDRGYLTITFAAPVTINGVTGNMGVTIRQTDRYKYKMHRILMPDGTVFGVKYKKSDSYHGRTADKNTSGSQPITVTSNDIISEKKPVVKNIDAEYLEAVKSGDMEKAARMVRAQAEKNGYTTDTDWRINHSAPSREYDIPITNLTELYPENIYSDNAAKLYKSGVGFEADQKAINILRSVKDSPDKIVTVYRAVPNDVKDTRLRNGDWVTLTEEYAREHGNHSLDNDYRIIKNDVPARYLYTDANSIQELGYDNGREEAYQNTENNAKSLDTVTYDDDGNIIPLSKRFDPNNPDIRFKQSKGKSPRGAAMRIMKNHNIQGKLDREEVSAAWFLNE